MAKVAYSGHFFDEMEETNLMSARTVVPLVMDLVNPTSVVDVGCGRGLWLKVFTEAGVSDVEGCDGDYVERDKLAIPPDRFHAQDLEAPIVFPKGYDLAVCLEVAEHLPDAASDTLVKSLTTAAPAILFSAAIPLQGGSHHVNEQWPEYWEKKFKECGYIPVDPIRRHVWDNANVSFFYAQNILIYVKESELSKYPKLAEEIRTGHGRALSMVHPHLYTYYAERWRAVVPYLSKFPPSVLHGAKRLLSSLRR